MLINSGTSPVKIFKQGNFHTRLSFVIMGSANLFNKQITKGLLFLLSQIIYTVFMLTAGVRWIAGLITLGTKEQGSVYDPEVGFNVTVAGDNSMLFMIYGVMAIIITAVFLIIYYANLKSAYAVQSVVLKGKNPPSFKQDLKSLLDERFHFTMMSVPILGILAFTVLPLIFMILIAFTNYDRAHQPPGNLFDWVGLTNFKAMLWQNDLLAGTFFPVLMWTLFWAVAATVSCYLLGIIVALLINKKGIRFKPMWRTILVLTIAIPQFISLLIMRNMLNQFGPINTLLQNAGIIDEAIPFLTDVNWARATVILVNLWIGIPYTMLMTSGILMNIPQDLYEAARIDGAGPFKVFTKITMPQIWFVTAPFLITQFIGNINNFNIIYLLTGGEPFATDYYVAGKTDLLVTWLYKLTADEKDYNLASTIGILVFIISIVISLLAYRHTASYKKEDQYS
ncbi:MAG: sugar ABC transporter permease [Clostridia bacterium]|nr:sugar ABC transporter permease [Clostridia bacterium]